MVRFARDRAGLCLEAIEGGEHEKSKADYNALIAKSIEEMYRVLKFDRWMSFVFAHKDPEFWHLIIETAERCGFEYAGAVAQKNGQTSFKKRQNPFTVLSGQLIINFRKVRKPKYIMKASLGMDAGEIVLQTIEGVIAKYHGATLEQINDELIIKGLELGFLDLLKKEYSDLTPLLLDLFDYDNDTELFSIKQNKQFKTHVDLKLRVRYYLISYLRRMEIEKKTALFDEIMLAIMPLLKNGITPESQTILSVLEDIAHRAGEGWRLNADGQASLVFNCSRQNVARHNESAHTNSSISVNGCNSAVRKRGASPPVNSTRTPAPASSSSRAVTRAATPPRSARCLPPPLSPYRPPTTRQPAQNPLAICITPTSSCASAQCPARSNRPDVARRRAAHQKSPPYPHEQSASVPQSGCPDVPPATPANDPLPTASARHEQIRSAAPGASANEFRLKMPIRSRNAPQRFCHRVTAHIADHNPQRWRELFPRRQRMHRNPTAVPHALHRAELTIVLMRPAQLVLPISNNSVIVKFLFYQLIVEEQRLPGVIGNCS